jgi:GTPase
MPDKSGPAVILVGVQLPATSPEEYELSLGELQRLVETLGWRVAATLSQRRGSPTAATFIGPGKCDELVRQIGETAGVDRVAFDHGLTPIQLRNLREATGVEIFDRPAVILEIFAQHARTREAKLQVEMAKVKYLSPRKPAGHHERQTAGPGGKGIGESYHELERREVRDRITELRRELEAIHREQELRRRHREGVSKVAIVGYTNAGKSSLMRALTSSEVLVANQLFATLDTTIRALQPETQPRILVSDTVGFIRNLPHDLVASFRSTLDEALDASLLLHLVDASDAAFRSQIDVTREVLEGIGAGKIPSLLVLNKIDRVDPLTRAALNAEFSEAIQLSALNSSDVAQLRARIVDYFESRMKEEELVVPFGKEGAIGALRKDVVVLREAYENDGLHLKLKGSPQTLSAIRRKLLA